MKPKPGTKPQPKEETAKATEVASAVSGQDDNKLKGTSAASGAELPAQRINYKDDEETRFLLGRKLDYASTLANVCMLWWVSSLVFSGSIFAAVWSEKEKLSIRPTVHLLGICLGLFFIGVAAFGAHITWGYLPNLRRDLSSLPQKTDREDFFATELTTFQRSMTFGTVSFFFIFAFWIVFWIGLARHWW